MESRFIKEGAPNLRSTRLINCHVAFRSQLSSLKPLWCSPPLLSSARAIFHTSQEPLSRFQSLFLSPSPPLFLTLTVSTTQMLSPQPFTLMQMHLVSVWHTCLLSPDDAWCKYLFSVIFGGASTVLWWLHTAAPYRIIMWEQVCVCCMSVYLCVWQRGGDGRHMPKTHSPKTSRWKQRETDNDVNCCDRCQSNPIPPPLHQTINTQPCTLCALPMSPCILQ